MTHRYRPGSTIQRREVLHGELWMEHPVRVVDDDGTVLVVLLDSGSEFTFTEHPFGPHPWSHHTRWNGPQVLQLHREGDPYSVWKFFDDGVFRYWYVNFEQPIVRREGGFDSDDHELDLIIHPDGRREWKDVEGLASLRRTGRLTLDQIGTVLEAAEGVSALLDSGERWWAGWDDWTPAG